MYIFLLYAIDCENKKNIEKIKETTPYSKSSNPLVTSETGWVIATNRSFFFYRVTKHRDKKQKFQKFENKGHPSGYT